MHPLNIWYSNENDFHKAGVVSMLSLNIQFQLVRCGLAAELAKVASSSDQNYIICRIRDVARFVSMFAPLTVSDLRALAVCHHLPAMSRKPNLLEALLKHSCQSICELDCLLFKPILRPRLGPFIVRTLPPGTLRLTANQVEQLKHQDNSAPP
jgi:hypothetical protein